MRKRLIALAATLFAATVVWVGVEAGTAQAQGGNDWEFAPHSTHAQGGNDWEMRSTSLALGNDWEFTARSFSGNDWE